MALIVYDGFDHYNSATDMSQRYGVLQYYNIVASLQIGNGRAGIGNSIYVQEMIAGLNAGVEQITIGFGFNAGGVGATYPVQFLDQTNGDVQCQFLINTSNGTIEFLDSGGTVKVTALNAISERGWYFVEMQVLISTSAGTAALRVNGESLPSFPQQTGLNTQRSSNANCSGVYFGSGSGNLIDDLYIADGTTGPGSYPNNSFLGDVRCATLFPVGNNAVTWTPLANANWQEVSETAMDSDTSYNKTATVGAQDSYNFGSLDEDVNQVVGLQVTVAVRKEDAGSRTVAPVLVIGGTTYQGNAVSVDVSYLYLTSIWPINPATGISWAAADINGLHAGYLVVT